MIANSKFSIVNMPLIRFVSVVIDTEATTLRTSHFRFFPSIARSRLPREGRGRDMGWDLWECNTRNPETVLSAGYIQERVVRAGGRLRALGPHAAVPHSLRVLMRQVHLAPNPPRPIHPFPAVPSTTSFTWTLPTPLLPSPALPLSTLRLSGVANRSIAQVGHVCTRRRRCRHRRRRGRRRRQHRRQRMHFRARCYLSSRSRQRREWECAIRDTWHRERNREAHRVLSFTDTIDTWLYRANASNCILLCSTISNVAIRYVVP